MHQWYNETRCRSSICCGMPDYLGAMFKYTIVCATVFIIYCNDALSFEHSYCIMLFTAHIHNLVHVYKNFVFP